MSPEDTISRTIDSSLLPYSEVYRLYNYGSRLVEMNLLTKGGSGTVMYSAVGQNSKDNNIFTAIPYNENNSIGMMEVGPDDLTNTLVIDGSQCYGCTYFIRV